MFPKKKYAKSGGYVIVNDEHHERALGEGWSDNPLAPQAEPVKEPKQPKEPRQPKAKKDE